MNNKFSYRFYCIHFKTISLFYLSITFFKFIKFIYHFLLIDYISFHYCYVICFRYHFGVVFSPPAPLLFSIKCIKRGLGGFLPIEFFVAVMAKFWISVWGFCLGKNIFPNEVRETNFPSRKN